MGKTKPISEKYSKNVESKNQKMVQVNFTIPDSDLVKWRQFANGLGYPLARVIKEAMNQMIYKEISDQKTNNEFVNNLNVEIVNIKEQIRSLSNQYFETLKGITPPTTDLSIQDLIPRIKMFLQDLGPLTREKICDFVLLKDPSDEKKILVRRALSDLKEDGQIDYNIDDQTWGLLKRQP
jgi:hypothetical protein